MVIYYLVVERLLYLMKKNFVNDLIIVGVYGSVKMFDKEE